MLLIRHVVVSLWVLAWLAIIPRTPLGGLGTIIMVALIVPLYYQVYVRRDIVAEIVNKK